MADLIVKIAADPLHYIGAILALWAAYAFVRFIWGVTDFAFAMWNEEERMHGRTNIVWGVSWLIVLFVLWEVIRFIASWFGVESGSTTTGFWFTVILVPLYILYYLWKKLTESGGNGH